MLTPVPGSVYCLWVIANWPLHPLGLCAQPQGIHAISHPHSILTYQQQTQLGSAHSFLRVSFQDLEKSPQGINDFILYPHLDKYRVRLTGLSRCPAMASKGCFSQGHRPETLQTSGRGSETQDTAKPCWPRSPPHRWVSWHHC